MNLIFATINNVIYMKKNEDIFIKNLPTIDLHGYDRESARVATEDFIKENLTLQNEKIVIIHGIGEGIVKKSVHTTLAHNKHVTHYLLNGFNIGCTIVSLKIEK